MEIANFILTVLSVILALMAMGWINIIARYISRKRQLRKWSARRQFDGGQLLSTTRYGFQEFHIIDNILAGGDGQVSIKARVINLGENIVRDLKPPIVASSAVGAKPSSDDLQAWAKTGRRKLECSIQDWDVENYCGRIVIKLDPPISPGKSRLVRYGYTLPKAWSLGREFVLWDVGNPIGCLSGEVISHSSWNIHSPQWELPKDEWMPQIPYSDKHLRWRVEFPKNKQRYKLTFELSQ